MSEQTLTDLIDTTRVRGVPVPDVERLTVGRVWPVNEGWVGEVGDGASLHVVGGLLDSMQQAVDAVETAIRDGRTEAAQALAAAGIDAGRFTSLLAPPQIKVYQDQGQAQPQVLTLST